MSPIDHQSAELDLARRLLAMPRELREAFLEGLELGAEAARVQSELRLPSYSEENFSWGVQAIGADGLNGGGNGISVAVLDTGCGPHPDLQVPVANGRDFFGSGAIRDLNGHGTHCSGTLAASIGGTRVPRYSVAPLCRLLVGRVLDQRGRGTDGHVLAGLDWALKNEAVIVSMSFGAVTLPGEPHSVVFETVAHRLLAKDVVLVAASGNESERPGRVRPVAHPANCPTVVAVGAVRPDHSLASFSNGASGAGQRDVDLVAPGVDILSAWPSMLGNGYAYKRLNGTSTATPHVAGVGALIAESSGFRGLALRERLLSAFRPLRNRQRLSYYSA